MLADERDDVSVDVLQGAVFGQNRNVCIFQRGERFLEFGTRVGI